MVIKHEQETLADGQTWVCIHLGRHMDINLGEWVGVLARTGWK